MNLLRRLRSLIKQTNEETPEEDPLLVMQQVLDELESAQTQLEQNLGHVREQEVANKQKFREAQQQTQKVEQALKQRLKKGQESEAKQLLTQKRQYERTLQHYQTLQTQLQNNRQRLVEQLEPLKRKIEKLRLDRTLLKTNLAQVKTQQEVAAKLDQWNYSTDWESVEDDLNRTAFELELKLDTPQNSPNVPEETLEDLVAKQQQAAQEESLQRAEELLARTPQAAKVAKTPNKPLEDVESFFQKKAKTPSSKDKLLDDFFSEKSKRSPEQEEPSSAAWEDFFGKD